MTPVIGSVGQLTHQFMMHEESPKSPRISQKARARLEALWKGRRLPVFSSS